MIFAHCAQLWDTAGQDRFQSLGTAFYRGADCCALVYDVTNNASFEHLSQWHAEASAANTHDGKCTIQFIVIGNKIDQERSVSATRAKAWCAERGFAYFETSAKESVNVDLAFVSLAKSAAAQQSDPTLWPGIDQGVKLNLDEKTKRTTCC